VNQKDRTDFVKKKMKIALLFLIVSLMLVITIKQSFRLLDRFEVLEFPTKQSRNISELGLYNVMTVEEISIKYEIKEDEIFKMLDIEAEDEDEKLNLRDLRKKHNKTSTEFKESLKRIIESHNKVGDPND
jgi:hypothetical protein